MAPRLRQQAGTIGGVRVQQLAIIELAAALVLVGWSIHPAALTAAIVIAAILVIFALGRRRRIPLPEWITTVRAMKRRGKESTSALAATQGVDPAIAPVVECEPALRTYEFTTESDQRAIGFVGDGTFLTALVQVDARDEPLRPERGSHMLPLEVLHTALDIEDIHLESVQFVQYTQPAPAPHLPEQAVAARSYAPLQAQAQTPALQLTWIALKLDPELCSEAIEARGGGMEGAKRSLLRAADQLVSRLTAHGVRARVLAEREVVAAIGTAVCVSPRAANGAMGRDGRAARRTQETTRAMRCDDRWHSTYWIGRWPQLGQGGAPLAAVTQLLTSTRAMASTFALTATHGSGRAPAISGYVRLSTRSENELTSAQSELERRSGSVKVGLVRLDREQLPGLLATLPLGGTR
ncbi:type VII secretion protein EccE [Streptomyces sp. RPA4-5]|uniref:type VII secretion protein EccE n=1 Tax=Streptomyces TaxID=1883 RepID=UPI00143E72E7|nr:MULTISPECIES: type VII secretion protein EccE [Streptomyces]MCX4635856.1 type VII secretion protein EccE [Streptomyces platensis]QIY57871.1 type VII secretion protein EccE [Streptomyces sp. RPA4-5]WJY41003.1 type VII secretion protein EccE [Streptomyces sp. P9-2B-2]